MIAPLRRRLRDFVLREEGSATIEAMLWIPLFFFVLVMAVEVTQVCVQQARVMRIVQDGNRAFALGRLDGSLACPSGSTVTATATLAYLRSSVGTISPNASFSSQVNCTTKVITSAVAMPVTDLTGYHALTIPAPGKITVWSQQVKEF